MRVLISVDMEGIAGVATPEDVTPGTVEYQRGRHLMTAEANAAVRGCLAFDPASEVVVADAHGPFVNLIPEELERSARLVRGRPRPGGMVPEVDRFDALICIGYHGRAQTAVSVLSHTISSAALHAVRVAGRPIGEFGLNSCLAAHHGVPTVLVSGDDTVAVEAAGWVQGVETVEVKRALGQRAAESLHPGEACDRIEAAVPAALGRRGEVRPTRLEGEVELEIDVHRESMLEHALLVPGIQRTGPVTLSYLAPDLPRAVDMVRLVAVLASAT